MTSLINAAGTDRRRLAGEGDHDTAYGRPAVCESPGTTLPMATLSPSASKPLRHQARELRSPPSRVQRGAARVARETIHPHST